MFNFSKRHKKFIAVFLLILGLSLAGYNRFIGVKKGGVESAVVTDGNLNEELTLSGTVEAEEKAVLRFQTSGRLVWVGVKEGDYVKKYQGLAALDQRQLQKTLEKNLNDYLKTRWDFETVTRDTYKDQVVTDVIKRIKEKSQFDLNKSVLDVEIQTISKEYASLWTPIEGIVTQVAYPFAGINVLSTTDAFTVVNPNSIYFSVNAEQTDVTKLKEEMPGELLLDAYPDQKITGRISQIAFTPKSGETGTVYSVKFTFKETNANDAYRTGMTGDVSFLVGKKNDVLLLPVKFVKGENGKRYVLVEKKKGVREKREIETGLEADNLVEIISGLKKGEVVYD